ncbi:SDR family NAD(P)-dependent oxidoreductase [Gordonia polyisoprenivorans]|uniref:SDR family NAD(P)-dependent oxidoreductase n=1 Tax=Gordonia polyisoprenivorans TaxID=84595 RepID=UPI001AD62ABB|nr:SDR family NAD(P)-dependent oxidoreductase [Gordonia polyisoprenivorans]
MDHPCAQHVRRLDRRIQSAAIVHHKLIEDSRHEVFERGLAVNLLGPYPGVRAVLPGMQRSGGGAIVNRGSG